MPDRSPDSHPVSVVQLPDLVALDAFTLAGPTRRFGEDSKAEIPMLWSRLLGALPFAGQLPSWASYGLVWNVDRAEGGFDYMAGVAVREGGEAGLPAGFVARRIPAATYAVFRITLDGGPLHPQVKGAMAKIWGELVPASGLRVAGGPDFELYDGRIPPDRPGAIIDFHIPVER